ncbi:MAG: tetratricopeptide repeat protein [Proteobacteria bacterium]|nr:tetratricopeptide repeat protein [Pseudomonadota bacterium]
MSAALAESMRRISGLLQAGRLHEAQAQLAALLASHPRYVEGLRLLAAAKQMLGEVAQAEALLRRALEVDPRWPPTLTALAELLLASGRGEEAVPLLDRAVRSTPPYARAALLLARHHLDAGQPAYVLEVTAPWCGSAPEEPELCALEIAAYAALDRQEEAVARYRRLAEAAPQNGVAAQALAAALNAAGQAQEAEAVARRLLARSAPTASLLYTRARSLIDLERLEEAEQALRECLRLDPRRASAHDSLAQLVWLRSGDIAEATATLDEALARFPHDDALRGTKAALLQGAGELRAAFACLAERAAQPQAPPNLLLRAGLVALDVEPETALALAERSLAAQPGSLTALKLLCAACLGTGDAPRALEACARLLAATPDDQYLIAMYVTALRLLGDPRYAQYCDYERMVLAARLEPPPGWPDLEGFLGELATRLHAMHDRHRHRLLFQSLRQGTETTQDLSRSPDPVVQALFHSFAAPIARYRESIGEGPDPLRRRNRGASRFNGSWSVRLQRTGYHTSHVHPRGWISSACYIQLPGVMRSGRSGEGVLSFGGPGLLTRPALEPEYAIRPRAGELVLFPSYFWHGTLPFHSDEPRLTVAFDVVPGAGN